MRSYPANSPQAAARIIALAMLADGHLSQGELDVLQRHGGCDELGLDADQLHDVLLGLCEDLQHGSALSFAEACRIDARALSQLLAEIDAPRLRERVLALCLQVAQADRQLDEAEALLLALAARQWGLASPDQAAAAVTQPVTQPVPPALAPSASEPVSPARC